MSAHHQWVRYSTHVQRLEDLPRVTDDLSPAERLRMALELSDVAIVLVRERARREHSGITNVQLDGLVDAWLATRPGAESGDATGRPVTWPRTRTP